MSKLGNVPHRYARYAEIMFYEDASGWQTFKYGKLGELTENIRTFALPFENQTYTFKCSTSTTLSTAYRACCTPTASGWSMATTSAGC